MQILTLFRLPVEPVENLFHLPDRPKSKASSKKVFSSNLLADLRTMLPMANYIISIAVQEEKMMRASL